MENRWKTFIYVNNKEELDVYIINVTKTFDRVP